MELLESMTVCNASFTAVLVHSYMTSAGPTSPVIYFPKTTPVKNTIRHCACFEMYVTL
jgi:hypothetical protein